ncbi:hypothetical protein DIPPA_09755 [Diplonema papillatum]|nr:hypothetical protein DIPPA_09755 [Diplonema papillatum]
MTTVQKAVCGSNEAERLRTLLRQWVNDDEIPSFLGGDPIVAEDPTPIPRSIAEHGVRTKMQTKSLQLLRTIRNHGLKDYTETKRAYNLSRHPTPPPPQVCKPAPRSGVGSRLHLGKARRDEVKHTTPNPAPSGMLPTLPRLAASGKAGKPPEDAAGTLFFNQRNERLQNEIPKQMLRRDIFATEAKITIFRCGGHAGFKETGSVPAHEINAALSPGDAPASEAGDGLAEIIVVSPSVPQYNGTYLRVFRPSRPPNAGNPRRSDALAPTPTSFTWVSEDGDRRIIKSEKRWRIERTSYSWLEAANPHNGAHPANCEKWDAWDGDQQKWMYDPTFVIERAGPAKIVVYCPSHREYEGVYTKTDLDMSKLPVWERVDALGRLSPRRRQLERTSLMRLCSHQGHWVIYDAQYTFLESATSARSNIPTSYISWDRWDGPTRRWESAAVSLVMGGGGAMEHGWSDSVDPERQSINGRPQAFMTEIANVDDGTDLRSFIPQVELPSITVEDVLTGRASTLRREGAAAQSKATDELDDTKAETAKMVESLLFGFRSDMKLRDAQRLLGLVYRFSDNETSLAPIPNDFSKFAKAYAQEKSQFQHRCATEIRRMAKQRQVCAFLFVRGGKLPVHVCGSNDRRQ